MELPWSNYLYAVASLGMTFVGFCTIVLGLHQTIDKKGSKLNFLRRHMQGYIELGFSSVVIAMLTPMLAACGLSASLAWRWSSALIAVGLVLHVWYALSRMAAITAWKIPKRFWINSAITGLIVLSLIANALGYFVEPIAGPVVVAATWRLVNAVMVFFLTYEEFIESA